MPANTAHIVAIALIVVVRGAITEIHVVGVSAIVLGTGPIVGGLKRSALKHISGYQISQKEK